MRKLLAILLMLGGSAQALGCEKYDTPGVTLTGTVKIKTFYGPPNYGEQPATDSKEQQAILLLSKPLCTLESKDDQAEKDEMEVTLVPMGNVDFDRYANKSIKVSGSLFHAFTAHHNTTLLLEVTKEPQLLAAQPAKGK